MTKEKEIERLANDINTTLSKLEGTFWDVYVAPGYGDRRSDRDYEREDNETWLYHGTRILYYKICLFLELKGAIAYLAMFKSKFSSNIEDEKKTTESRGPLYSESDPSMIIHDDFREFLSAFPEFDYDLKGKSETNKLRLILENTVPILDRTKTDITNETSIYNPIRWVVEIIYPMTRGAGKSRFIRKFKTYKPDILVPEISSAVEYKIVRAGQNPATFLEQIKTDADNYKGDPDYKLFYAVVYYEVKSELNRAAFDVAVKEMDFPENWTVFAL